MKKFLKILVGLFVALVLLAAALILFLDQAVLKAVNEAGPAALGVPVRLEGAKVRPFRGKATLTGLHVGNPKGFKTDGILDLGSITVKLDLSSLLSDVIVVEEIAVDGLVVTYEKGLLNSNLGALIDQLSAGEDKPSEASDAEEEEPTDEKPGPKVVIEKLTIAGSQMKFSVTGAAALTGGGALPIPLPEIVLTDLGKEKEGATLVETIRTILDAIAGTAGSALAGVGGRLGEGVGALGGGTVDAGKAVVGGTVEAGKALAEGAGDALKAINPFGKK